MSENGRDARLDRVIDAALRQMAGGEGPADMRARVLARLADRPRRAAPRVTAMALATAAVILVALATVLWRHGRDTSAPAPAATTARRSPVPISPSASMAPPPTAPEVRSPPLPSLARAPEPVPAAAADIEPIEVAPLTVAPMETPRWAIAPLRIQPMEIEPLAHSEPEP
jgi:hypothetical protein